MLLLFGYWLLWHAAKFFEAAPFVSTFYPARRIAIAFICVYGIRYLPHLAVATVVSSLPVVSLHGYSVGSLVKFLWQRLLHK